MNVIVQDNDKSRLQDQEGMLEQAQQRHEAMTRMLDELNVGGGVLNSLEWFKDH